MRNVVLFFFALLWGGCAVPVSIETGANWCEGVICPPTSSCFVMFSEPICIPERVPADYCDLDCGEEKECRFERCLEPNLNGAICEFDDACFIQEICVLGHCTGVICEPGEAYPCYSGPAGTLGIGECYGGVHLCTKELLFSEECVGEVLPVEEVGLLACNGKDDNCDGISDLGTLSKVDLIFAFDVSGSMTSLLPSVSLAIELTAGMYNSPDIYMSLIIFPSFSNYSGWEPEVIIPLQEYSTFYSTLNIFASLLQYGSNGGNEASWDIIPLLVSNQIDGISLREDAQTIVIMYTDEKGQSWNNNTEETMCRVVEDNDIAFYILTYDPFIETFDDCSSPFLLSNDSSKMAEYLSDIVNDVCQN